RNDTGAYPQGRATSLNSRNRSSMEVRFLRLTSFVRIESVYMTEENWMEHYRRIADHILGEGDYLADGPAPAPDPIDADAPPWAEGDYWPGDDDAELLPHDLDPDEMRKVDPAVIERCAAEPQNDTGNGQRLLHHFAVELLNVREIGWH